METMIEQNPTTKKDLKNKHIAFLHTYHDAVKSTLKTERFKRTKNVAIAADSDVQVTDVDADTSDQESGIPLQLVKRNETLSASTTRFSPLVELYILDHLLTQYIKLLDLAVQYHDQRLLDAMLALESDAQNQLSQTETINSSLARALVLQFLQRNEDSQILDLVKTNAKTRNNMIGLSLFSLIVSFALAYSLVLAYMNAAYLAFLAIGLVAVVCSCLVQSAVPIHAVHDYERELNNNSMSPTGESLLSLNRDSKLHFFTTENNDKALALQNDIERELFKVS